jgi:predicted DsbA family dithiol-disulfide isomerase
VKVEIYSDVVCPWCYIGKRRFESALEQYEHADEVEVVWRPFQLDPRAPSTPAPALDGYARKFGGPAAAAQITDRLTSMGAEEGLDFDFGIAQRANTFDAHRLLWLAERDCGPTAQDRVKERLLRAYFTEGRDVADHAELTRIATEAGLDGDHVAKFLASTDGVAEVQAEIVEGLERGVTAVPTFVFEGQWSVPGAQDPETMLIVLRRVRERLGGEAPAAQAGADANACTDDACEL